MRRDYAIGAAVLTMMLVWSLNGETAASRRDAGTQPPPKIKEEPAVVIVSIEGKDTFAAYCAVCHGADGKGRGPAAPALAKPASDLTQLASRQGGKLNLLAVEATITGRDRRPAAHGTVDMPMWGPIFHQREPDVHRASLRLSNLMKYLESMQQK